MASNNTWITVAGTAPGVKCLLARTGFPFNLLMNSSAKEPSFRYKHNEPD